MALNTQSRAPILSHMVKSKRKRLLEPPQEKDTTTSSPLKELIISDNSNSLVDRNNKIALNNFSQKAYDRLKQQVQSRRIGPTTSALVRPALPCSRPSPGAVMRNKPTKKKMKLNEDTDSDIISNSAAGKKGKFNLKNHLATHTGVKPFKCDICSFAAVTKRHLKIHLATHTGVKLFKCDNCSYVAVQKSHLKYHLATHTGVKPFKCDICSQGSK